MIDIKVKGTDISIYIGKDYGKDTYYVVSGDSDGHEGLLAEGLTTIKELFDVLAKNFGSK